MKGKVKMNIWKGIKKIIRNENAKLADYINDDIYQIYVMERNNYEAIMELKESIDDLKDEIRKLDKNTKSIASIKDNISNNINLTDNVEMLFSLLFGDDDSSSESTKENENQLSSESVNDKKDSNEDSSPTDSDSDISSSDNKPLKQSQVQKVILDILKNDFNWPNITISNITCIRPYMYEGTKYYKIYLKNQKYTEGQDKSKTRTVYYFKADSYDTIETIKSTGKIYSDIYHDNII